MAKPYWRSTAAAFATAMLLGVAATDASALAIGRVTVQSALGEPLRAEIDIPEITPEEINSLRTNVAGPDAFKAAGVEYNPALSNVRITLERRADGRYFLRLVSTRPINDPFVDLILETTWASGRVVRDYTMLLDPPSMRQNQTPLSAQTSPGPSAPSRAAAATAAPATRPARTPAAPAAATASGTAPATAAAPTVPAPAGERTQVTVRPGETAGLIASSNKPANVSLDQMLVAMLRTNPDAFAGGNVNRLRAGAVVDLPTGTQAAAIPAEEARQTLVAQSRDFNEFRRLLAEGVPATRLSPADRESSGKVTAQVDERRPAAAAPDKLTLSKGAAAGRTGIEERIARERAAGDTATRLAELNKNLADLSKVGVPTTATGTAPAAAANTTKPGVPVALGTPTAASTLPTTAVTPAATTPPAASLSAPASGAVAPTTSPALAGAAATAAVASSAPVNAATAPGATTPGALAPAAGSASMPVVAGAQAAASGPAPVASAAPATLAAAPGAAPKPATAPAEASFLDEMIENPVVPAGLGAALALLLGFGFYRAQQRKKSAQVDSSFLESRLQPDSFFGASGGQRIDTNEGGVTGSSMVYSPSQLDAAGDVDPVAEADVYLAYGRDLQAEEILKEAMRTQPQRVSVHSKLLEIYAKRRDAKAFEVVAAEAHKLTRGQGLDWEHICELGRELDASNPLYRPDGQPSGAGVAAGSMAAPIGAFGATTATQALAQPDDHGVTDLDLDLDLDFSLGDDEPAAATDIGGAPESTRALHADDKLPPMPALDMDFGSPAPMFDLPVENDRAEPARREVADLNNDGNALSFDLDLPEDSAPPSPARAAASPAPEAGMIEFDLGSLSLDLPGNEPEPTLSSGPVAGLDDVPDSTAGVPLSTAGFDDTGGDPLATKLALAQEFNAIGDPDGARSLAQEVVAEASGDLKSAAQKFLADIS